MKGGTMKAKLFETKINLSPEAKKKSIGMLNAGLAATIDLALAVKQAHWNIKGPRFIGLHKLLDEFRDELDEHVDTIAERIAQLGGTALGTVQDVAEATTLKRYPSTISTSKDHLAELITRYGAVGNQLRAAIAEAAEAGDDVTSDLFTAATAELDKSLWFLEAHTQEKE
jgi:starvation-inducible DNA-binding protein